MKKKKIRNRKGSFMVEPKDYRCSLSKLALERKNDYLVAVTMRDKDALAVCKALQEIAGNYKISIHTRIINTAVKVIGIKIDNMNFNCD